MQPFVDLILHGKPAIFLQQFPKYIGVLSYYRHWKVSRCLLSQFARLTFYRESRPDIFGLVLQNCQLSNDNFIEHFNSLLARFLAGNRPVESTDIQAASVEVPFRSAFIREVCDTLGMSSSWT